MNRWLFRIGASSETPDPRKLMELASRGDARAFEELYAMYLTPVYRYLYSRVLNAEVAEDLSQDVFLKVYSSLRLFKSSSAHPLGYFFTVARNTLIDYYRKHKEVLVDVESEIFSEIHDANVNVSEEAIKREFLQAVRGCIDMLSVDQRDVVCLKFFSEFSNKEIALALQKSEEAVRQLQSRAMKEIRIMLREKKFL